MQRTLLATLVSLCLLISPILAAASDPLPVPPASPPRQGGPDTGTAVQGVRELLAVATDRAVKAAAKPGSFSGNPAISVGMPEEMEHLPTYMAKYGHQPLFDAFLLSMNRTAEKAAPKAAALFADALREATIADPGKILNGGVTAATDYFRKNSAEKLAKAFLPAVTASMNEAGVLPAYREILAKYDYESVEIFPVDKWDFDMEGYLTGKALDGIFHLMGEEEKKIRKDPAAQTSELLRKVFGSPQ